MNESANTSSIVASSVTASKAAPSTTAGKIEAWFVEHFHNSAVSRAPTEVYNAAHTAKEELKAIFSAPDAPSGPDAVGKAVDGWYTAHFLDSPIARASAEVSDLCQKAKEKLKTLLGAGR